MQTKFSIGERVYYTDAGPEDSGTIVEIDIYSIIPVSPLKGGEMIVYGVQWDNESAESGLIEDNGGFSANQLTAAS